MSDSQMLRWIDELNGITNSDDRARRIKREIKRIKHNQDYPDAKKRIRFLYDELDRVEFKKDYMMLVADTKKDYLRACNGFSVNGVTYTRLLGTPGGIKTSTIVFVSERLAPELRRRIDNGRDMSKELVPAKFEAYRALTCSGSIAVSAPRGIAIIPDCDVKIYEDVVRMSDHESGEPLMSFESGAEIGLNACDGCGMMLPALAERWSAEAELGYVSCGFNTRMSWEKGVLFTFDFLDFAEHVAHSYIIKDAWGNDVDLREVEAIFPVSMVKLWDSYPSCEEYLRNCEENHYTFNITKQCPETLDIERDLNYQFLQSYELTDDELRELVSPTMTEINDILDGDPMKTVLFMKGTHLTPEKALRMESDCFKGLMVDPDLMNDPFVRRKVWYAIKGRIDGAKVGVIRVHGNFSIIAGDLYALCESMFGIQPRGVLNAGELYSQFWRDDGADTVACFRAPMSCHANIRTQRVSVSKRSKYWFRYLNTCTVINARDTLAPALNGADEDGDLIFTTDNDVLVRNTRNLPAIICDQGRAPKTIPTEDLIIQSNIAGFGDDIGKITNRITAMFEVQTRFQRDSEEYKVLEYRIQAGQKLQQDCIDRNFCRSTW